MIVSRWDCERHLDKLLHQVVYCHPAVRTLLLATQYYCLLEIEGVGAEFFGHFPQDPVRDAGVRNTVGHNVSCCLFLFVFMYNPLRHGARLKHVTAR